MLFIKAGLDNLRVLTNVIDIVFIQQIFYVVFCWNFKHMGQ